MIYLIVLCLQITRIRTAPLQMLHPHEIPMIQMQQQMMQASQQVSLQQQLMELQQLQALQKLNTIHSPLALTIPQPLQLIILPQPTTDIKETNELLENSNQNNPQENEVQNTENEKGYEDKDLDSIVVDTEMNVLNSEPLRAIIISPNRRAIIGDFISSIPWLPFEVNVPDSIAWAYNGISSGISGIISIIGQRLPFRPQTKDSAGQRLFMKQLMMKQNMPILVLPVNDLMLLINK